MKEVNAILGKDIFLGRCGENKATCVSFNISDWQKTYGDGTPYVLHQRNGDKQPYPCDIEANGSIITWCITNSDLVVAGRGRVELQYYKDDTLVKSETFTTVTERALGPASENAPEPYESWMETMLHTTTQAQESAEVAVESAATAVSSASAAAKSESNAKASEIAAASSASATALDAITAKSNAEIAYEYSAAAKGYMAEADGSRKAAVEAAIEAQAHANSIVGDKEAAAASAASAKASASEAATSKAEAAASAAEAKTAVYNAARDAAAEVEAELVEKVAEHVAAAERAEELARNAANESVLNQQAAQTHARTASNHADRAIEAVNDALDAQSAAERAQAAAEAAAKDAQQAAGGDFATPAYVDNKVAESEYNVIQYMDRQIANIPTPDVSGQINAHNTNSAAHADIRQMAESAGTLAASAQTDATNALRDADYAWREAMGKTAVFYCYSDLTTLEEIDERVDYGDVVVLHEINSYIPMVFADPGVTYLFRGAIDDTMVLTASVDSDGWTVTEKPIVPADHASDEDTYGMGKEGIYGHVKLSDSTVSSSNAVSGIAATPLAVKTAYDKAVSAQTTANTAKTNAATAQSAANAAQATANEALASAGYSKAETLADATKTGWGLPTSAVPDDVFAQFVKHSWSKAEVLIDIAYGTNSSTRIAEFSSTTTSCTISYSTELEVDDSETVKLKNPTTVTVTRDTESLLNSVKGHFWKSTYWSNTDYIFWTDANAADFGTSASQYARYANIYAKQITPTVYYGEASLVTSYDSGAYPESGNVNGFHYEYKGQLLNNIMNPASMKIATGSYTGANAGVTLNFDFTPKFVLLTNNHEGMVHSPMIYGCEYIQSSRPNSYSYMYYCREKVTWGEKSLTITYSNQNCSACMNGTTYHYAAIG